MDDLYLVVCINDKTNDQRAFVARNRSVAQSIKDSFLSFVSDLPDWFVTIIRSDEE